jgi:STE24 endopeptidase
MTDMSDSQLHNDEQGKEAKAPAFDRDRQNQAKEYARIRRRLMLVDIAVAFGYMLIWLVTGLSIWWRDQVLLVTTNPWLTILLFAVGLGALYTVLGAPLSYYSGFVLPHRYRLSHQTLGAWLWDQIKAMAIGGLLAAIVLEVVYYLLRVAPTTWWLWAALVMLALSVLLSNLAPVLIFPLFYKFIPLENQELRDRLLRLAGRAGTHVGGVYTFDESRKTSTANAALVGLGNTRRIVLADTLIESFSGDEIETVLAHELGHHVHRDLIWGIIVQSLLNLVGFWLVGMIMRWGVLAFGFKGVADPAGLPLLVLALTVYGLIVMPAGNAWSRWRERLADRYALEATANPTAFASAMTRLADQNLADAEPPAWVEFLLHSHPSISKRVAMAEGYSE